MTKKQYRAYIRKQGWMCVAMAVCALGISIAFVIGLGLHCRKCFLEARERVSEWSK
jgi:hypothetical protein